MPRKQWPRPEDLDDRSPSGSCGRSYGVHVTMLSLVHLMMQQRIFILHDGALYYR